MIGGEKDRSNNFHLTCNFKEKGLYSAYIDISEWTVNIFNMNNHNNIN